MRKWLRKSASEICSHIFLRKKGAEVIHDEIGTSFVKFVCLACFVVLVSASEYLAHDYDVQIHPIHGYGGHHGYDEHEGFATSIRYDKRYHHKIPDYGHHDDAIYQYVSEGHQELDDAIY
ncbi:hypothetical protein TNCT_421961 [Trichonephila clavata]|uniref:Uncharacterized protein n=1 Tax=Trichonephila clavata TaxID=2740835 RepID=A0A8X6KZ48_TRICU|nr:hypothetical protein TNCT_421961 [Trichonephila clavata]